MKRWLICLAISSLIPASFSISYVSGSWTKSISLKLPFSEQSDRKLLTDPYRDLFMTPNLAPSVKSTKDNAQSSLICASCSHIDFQSM